MAKDKYDTYAASKNISRDELIIQLDELSKQFKELYVTGTFDLGDDDEKAAHDAMGAAFKADPALLGMFNDHWTANEGGGDDVQQTLRDANDTMFVADGVRSAWDAISGSDETGRYEQDLLGPYGYSKTAGGNYALPGTEEQAKEAEAAAIAAAATETDKERDARVAKEKADAAEVDAVDKTLDNPAPENPNDRKRSVLLDVAAKRMKDTVRRGGGHGTMPNRLKQQMEADAKTEYFKERKEQKRKDREAETNRLQDGIMAANDDKMRGLYDSDEWGRKAGDWDALSPEAQKTAFRNWNLNQPSNQPTLDAPATVETGEIMYGNEVAPAQEPEEFTVPPQPLGGVDPYGPMPWDPAGGPPPELNTDPNPPQTDGETEEFTVPPVADGPKGVDQMSDSEYAQHLADGPQFRDPFPSQEEQAAQMAKDRGEVQRWAEAKTDRTLDRLGRFRAGDGVPGSVMPPQLGGVDPYGPMPWDPAGGPPPELNAGAPAPPAPPAPPAQPDYSDGTDPIIEQEFFSDPDARPGIPSVNNPAATDSSAVGWEPPDSTGVNLSDLPRNLDLPDFRDGYADGLNLPDNRLLDQDYALETFSTPAPPNTHADITGRIRSSDDRVNLDDPMLDADGNPKYTYPVNPDGSDPSMQPTPTHDEILSQIRSDPGRVNQIDGLIQPPDGGSPAAPAPAAPTPKPFDPAPAAPTPKPFDPADNFYGPVVMPEDPEYDHELSQRNKNLANPAAPEPPTFQPAPEEGYDFAKTEAGHPDNALRIPVYGDDGKGGKGLIGYQSLNDAKRLKNAKPYNPFTEEGMKRKYAESPHMRPQQPQGQPAFGFKDPRNTQNYRAQRGGQPPARQNPGMRTVDDNKRLVAQAKSRGPIQPSVNNKTHGNFDLERQKRLAAAGRLPFAVGTHSPWQYKDESDEDYSARGGTGNFGKPEAEYAQPGTPAARGGAGYFGRRPRRSLQYPTV